MSQAFEQLQAGSAPFNETEAFHRNAQRDDAEATDPESVQERQRAADVQLPDGFYMGSTADGRPMAKPTLAYARDILAEVRDVFDNRDLREDECDASSVVNGLSRTFNALAKHNEFAANGFLYSLERAHSQSFAAAVRWLLIHANNVQRFNDNGNESAAENSLLSFETSKRQAFVEAAILDYCADNGVDVNLQRGVDAALNLAGWQIMNQQAGSSRRQAQQTTRELLWNGRQEEQTASPEEALEEDGES
jgi:hypothetical protein